MIDTHQHLLYPETFRYPWAEGVPALQGDFHLKHYWSAAESSGITGTVFMEVDVDSGQSVDEARHFCRLAEDPANKLLGVVASARPETSDFEAHLDGIAHPKLVGIRRVLHTQADELSQGALFRRHIGLLGERSLTFDLCVLQRQLGLAVELARACPGTTMILDHCGVPDIASNDAPSGAGFLAWKKGIQALAAEPHVVCKISGLTAYAGEDQQTKEGLAPYVETVLEAFGPSRCLWGGDWPVVNLGSGLARWTELATELIGAGGTDVVAAVCTENARRIYRLGA
jgi:predicted TIM-barrel fold metal-dependent hydrolase